MAWRLADSFVKGYLYNTCDKSTHGTLYLEGIECPISFELTGDPGETLRGRSFSFQRGGAEPPPVPIDGAFLPRQVGVVGSMELRMVKVPVEGYLEAIKEGRTFDFTWLPSLYLEWYGPNGRVVLELANPLILIKSGPPFDDPPYPDGNSANPMPTITEIRCDPDGHVDLRAIVPKPQWMEEDGADPDESSWGERLMFSPEGDFLASFLEPEKLPPVDEVDEERAAILVHSILAQLALYHVAIHLCKHCTWLQAYDYILNEVLFESRVPREIVHSEWTMNLSYGERCPLCEEEIMKDYGEMTSD